MNWEQEIEEVFREIDKASTALQVIKGIAILRQSAPDLLGNEGAVERALNAAIDKIESSLMHAQKNRIPF